MILKRFFSTLSKTKIVSIPEAISKINSNSIVAVGGFGCCGVPNALLHEVVVQNKNNLTVISNNAGLTNYGIGQLITNRSIKRQIAAHVGSNKLFQQQYLNGEVEFEITPQGTIAEKLRSAGDGSPAFWTKTGVGTLIEHGGWPIKYQQGNRDVIEILSPKKENRIFHNKKYIMEDSIYPDVSLIKAHKADTFGNQIYNKSARNFNQNMATAGKYVIAEVEEIVEAGELDPNFIHTPGIYVDQICLTNKNGAKIFEDLVLFNDNVSLNNQSEKDTPREIIAKRIAKEVKDGMFVNIGIGIPTLVPKYIARDIKTIIQSENGFVGMGPPPRDGQQDYDLINASKETCTVEVGASFFSSAESFGMIRGAHLDMTVLGAMQVSGSGDIANWSIPGKMVKGIGGAMDLVGSGIRTIVAMEHVNKGFPKILKECTLPLTGQGVVDTIVTDLAVFQIVNNELILREIYNKSNVEEVRAKTQCPFTIDDNLKKF